MAFDLALATVFWVLLLRAATFLAVLAFDFFLEVDLSKLFFPIETPLKRIFGGLDTGSSLNPVSYKICVAFGND
ncbi:MAG: hypothetical protein JJV98_19150 [Desulfosarcina sp.]|nr:hypothetical protein [Desulfobacterales bacterium]